MSDNYINELENTLPAISKRATAEIRGNGISSFIYAFTNEKSIELSKAKNTIQVEFWFKDKESSENNNNYSDYKDAVIDVNKWFE